MSKNGDDDDDDDDDDSWLATGTSRTIQLNKYCQIGQLNEVSMVWTWSPDGQKVTFVWNVGIELLESFYLQDREGNERIIWKYILR
jgi:hypothetical protein